MDSFQRTKNNEANKSPKKDFDPNKYTTRFVAFKLAYLGQRYNGFEYHANNDTPLPTIEEELWKALTKTKLILPTSNVDYSWEGCEYSKCGRTDKGVSAFGQVISLKVRSNRPTEKVKGEHDGVPFEISEDGDESDNSIVQAEICFDPIKDELSYPRILNRVLPEDIRVFAWCPSVPSDFNARFSCRERRYRYFFTQPAYMPFPGSAGIATRRTGKIERDGWLDITAMQEAASHFIGVQDFRNFCKIDPSKQITNFERNISYAGIEEASGQGLVSFLKAPGVGAVSPDNQTAKIYTFTVFGSAFLWHQIRHMVAILFLVGQGLEEPSIVSRLLDVSQTPARPHYEMANDAPLVLWDCLFPEKHNSREDGLQWLYCDSQSEARDRKQAFSTGSLGPGGIDEVLWAGWRQKKMDEILAGSLLDVVAARETSLPDKSTNSQVSKPYDNPFHSPMSAPSTKIFDGGNRARLKGEYTPIMARKRMESPKVVNARWLERKVVSGTAVGPSVVEEH